MARKPNESRRVIMRIDLLPKANVESVCSGLGLTQVAAISHVVDWFCQQSDTVQAAILGLHPGDIRSEVPMMIMKRIASETTR